MNIYDLILNKKPDTQIYTGNISSLSPLKFRIYATDTEIPCKSVTSLLGAQVGSNVILLKINNQFIITSIVDAISPVESDITAIESVNTVQSTAIASIESVNVVQSTAIASIESVNVVQSTAIASVATVNTSQSTAIANLESRLRYLKKASPTSRANTTVLAADPHLTIALSANKIYHVRALIGAGGGSSYRIKCDWTVTSTLTFLTDRQCAGAGYSSTDVYLSPVSNWTARAYNAPHAYGITETLTANIREEFIVSGGASGGTLTFRWAQSTSGATNTTVGDSSFLIINEIVSV